MGLRGSLDSDNVGISSNISQLGPNSPTMEKLATTPTPFLHSVNLQGDLAEAETPDDAIHNSYPNSANPLLWVDFKTTCRIYEMTIGKINF